MLLISGKVAAIALLLAVGIINPGLIGMASHAADDPVLKGNDIVNPLNTVWVLVAAFLVFGMQVGFTMLEAGFCRSQETVNVLMECIVDTCLCGILFFAWGFSFMFSPGNGLNGYHWFFLNGAPTTYETTGVAFLAFWLFQFAFADTCSTITSGAMIGRTGWTGNWCTALRFPDSSIPSLVTGPGDRMGSLPPWVRLVRIQPGQHVVRVGFFASGQYGLPCALAADDSLDLKGLFYRGGTQVLTAQFVGSAITTVSTFVVALVVMYVVNAMGILRVSPEGERYGLDLHEHGISAYAEYVIAAAAMPAGMAGHSTDMAVVAHTAPKPAR